MVRADTESCVTDCICCAMVHDVAGDPSLSCTHSVCDYEQWCDEDVAFCVTCSVTRRDMLRKLSLYVSDLQTLCTYGIPKTLTCIRKIPSKT
ncbi:hypothetical protein TNCV_3902391 [Trichonephila clavipes]|nr:hypothetical protein TNCV_3902391 [Trichonephila clavipes]